MTDLAAAETSEAEGMQSIIDAQLNDVDVDSELGALLAVDDEIDLSADNIYDALAGGTGDGEAESSSDPAGVAPPVAEPPPATASPPEEDLVETLEFDVDGETIQVTADEYAQNWMYRSQLEARENALRAAEEQFASLRQRADNAMSIVAHLEANPAVTLQALAREFGVPTSEPAPAASDPYGYQPDPYAAQPSTAGGEQIPAWAQQFMNRFTAVEQTVDQLRNQNGQLAAIERDRVHRGEFDRLAEQYPNHGVTYEEVSAHWRNARLPNFETAFSSLALPRMREHSERAAAAAAQRRGLARQQAQLAQSGAGGSRGSATPSEPPASGGGVQGAISRALAERRALRNGRV